MKASTPWRVEHTQRPRPLQDRRACVSSGRETSGLATGRLIRCCTYTRTLFALLLPPSINVSGCLVREREREGIKYGTGILVQNSNTRTLRKGHPFFETKSVRQYVSVCIRETSDLATGRLIICFLYLLYSSTLIAPLLPPSINVSGCLVRERDREGIKYGTGILVQFEHTNIEKRAPYF